MSLNSQLQSFKKSFKANADIAVKRAGQAVPVKENNSVNGTISNNTKASFGSDAKKRKKSTVYSQPANTGTGHHAMSQLYTVIQFLKDSDNHNRLLVLLPVQKLTLQRIKHYGIN
ncbi:unnamed protein product [Mucor hiemalis]